MKTSTIDLFDENVLTISEMFNVRGGDGDEGASTQAESEDEDIII